MADARSVRSKSIGHYVLMKTIGEGTFGKVKLGTHILTGERVAVKVLEKERIVEVADVERVAREIHILKLIRHPHIIQLYEIIETPRQLYLIMEYACGGELFDYIVQHGRAEEREACRFLHQILAGVEKVHGMQVVHRDLKPENLLLDDRKDIKIVDFGLSNTYTDGQLLQTACGSPCYAAPEMIAGHRYVPSMVDIWSCGVILFALVCGYLPFESTEDQNHAELYKKILAAEYEMPDFISTGVAKLIGGMLTTDPALRLTLDGIRQHAWYKQIPEASTQDFEDTGILDEVILDQLDSYGFSREYARKCLLSNKHNHVTTTYFLLREKRMVAKAAGATVATDLAIADLDAARFFEDAYRPSAQGGAIGAAVAAVATPSRGHRAEGPDAEGSRRSSRWPGGDADGTSDPGMHWTTDMGSNSRPSRPVTPGLGPVPRLNLGDVGSAAADAERAATARCRSSGLGDDGPSPATGRGVSRRGLAEATAHHSSGGRSGATPRGATPRGDGAGARGRPHSARGYGGPPQRRGPSADAGRACSPYTAGGYWPYGDAPEDYNGYAGHAATTPRARRGAEMVAPLTARPRLQGNAPSSHRDRPYGVGAAPLSARSGGGYATARGGEDTWAMGAGQRGSQCQVSCKTARPPRQTVQELLRVLSACRIAHRQISGFLVRCQGRGVRFEAEVLQLSRGGGYVLRFSRVSGDPSSYKDSCAQLLAEMHL